jgi:hypothetical protein
MAQQTPITIEQKKSLCAHKALNLLLLNLALKEWFKAIFQQVIALLSISEILSTRYKYLDNPIHRPKHQQCYCYVLI